MKSYKLDDIKAVLAKNAFLYTNEKYRLNIVGIRSNPGVPNEFDDVLAVFYMTPDGVAFHQFPFTTDPGRYYLENPINVEGTAILKEGQYNVYQEALHRNEYMALCQRLGPVIVYRDPDRDDEEDFGGKTESGMFGVNIHHAGDISSLVNKWSAGCQVFQNLNDFQEFMKLVERHRLKFGNNFTYTLINERDFKSLPINGDNVIPAELEKINPDSIDDEIKKDEESA
jgi:hypothetical protein